MLPSQAEIEHTLHEHVRVEWDNTGYYVSGIIEATHAIAEKLAEGVVWEGKGTVATVAVHDGELTIVALGKAGGLLKLINCTSMREFHGQLVTVTVTREE